MKKLLVFILILTISLPLMGLYADDHVAVYLDNQVLDFDVNPRIINSRTMVPLRVIFEALGAQVAWIGQESKVVATKDDTTISLVIGDTHAQVKGQIVPLDVPALIIDGRTLVPLRFVSEALGAQVLWDGPNRAVYITSPSLLEEATTLTLGNSLSQVQGIHGQALAIYDSVYDFKWHVYHNDYKNLVMFGIKNDTVVGLYKEATFSHHQVVYPLPAQPNAFRNLLGTPLETITKPSGTYFYLDDHVDLFKVNQDYLRVFYDVHKQDQATAILLIEGQVENNHAYYYRMPSPDLSNSYNQLFLILINASRAKNDLPPLTWAQNAYQVALKHSQEMAEYQYFGHTSLNGDSVADRFEKAGIAYYYVGENLAMGQFSPIFAHHDLMNSLGHRQNVLGPFTYLGSAVAYDMAIPYYTQNFYSTFTD